MQKKLYKGVGGILFLISFLILVYICYGIMQGGILDDEAIITVGTFIGVPMLIGTILIVSSASSAKNKRKIVKCVTGVVFLAYILVLLYLLFIGFRIRHGFGYEDLWDYIRYNSNIVPFSTIGEYIKRYLNNSLNLDIIIKNLLGNFMLFMPMGILLPCLFKKTEKWRIFIISMIVILLGIEMIQMITGVGIFDIDDFILNFSGACIAFAIVKIKPVKNFLRRIYMM